MRKNKNLFISPVKSGGLLNSALANYKLTVEIHRAPQEQYSYFVNAGSSVPMGDISVPVYSKGVFVATGGGDGVMLLTDPSLNLYVGYRSGTTWYGRKL